VRQHRPAEHVGLKHVRLSVEATVVGSYEMEHQVAVRPVSMLQSGLVAERDLSHDVHARVIGWRGG
jgi:hypothetical protein